MIATVQGTMRERLIEAANELFYAQGLRAVSVDKVIDRAGTTKVTFYRHFRSKDDLIVAYLEFRAEQERDGVDAAIAHGDGDIDVSLGLMADHTGRWRALPASAGARSSTPPPSTPTGTALSARSSTRTVPGGRARSSGSSHPSSYRPAAVAADLMLLRDGVMVAGYLGDPAKIAASFLRSCQAVIHYAARQ